MTSPILESYEHVPYLSKPVTQSHPEALAVMGLLHGMSPPPVDRCRVLELGCAEGGNLISIASTLPRSQFVGIDLSPRQIADGQSIINAIGIQNVALKALSITEVDASWGKFDYILCHGVFSWVPDFVRDKILDICRDNLAPNGIAYVSYNTFPGWHERLTVREIMQFRAKKCSDPQERLHSAKSYLAFLTQCVQERQTAYAVTLKAANEWMKDRGDPYVYHEFLEDVNQPLHFERFVAMAADRGLRYLGEAGEDNLDLQSIKPELLEAIKNEAANRVEYEQHLDFIRNRMFRCTLLVHADQPINDEPDANVIDARNLFVSCRLQPTNRKLDLLANTDEPFTGPNDSSLSTPLPALKAAFVYLGSRAPECVRFDQLWNKVRSLIGEAVNEVPGGNGREFLCRLFLDCVRSHFNRFVELHTLPSRFTIEPGKRPTVGRLQRVQSLQATRVTSLNHKVTDLTPTDRLLLPHLDGTRTRDDLLRLMTKWVSSGELTLTQPDHQPRNVAAIRSLLHTELENAFIRLARCALFALPS